MKNTERVDSLNNLKITIYQRTLSTAALVIISVWGLHAINGTLIGFDQSIYPFFAFFCLLSLALFKIYGTGFLSLFENTGFGLCFVYYLSQFILEIKAGIGNSELDFRNFLLWIAILYTFAFLIFSLRKALWLSLFYIFCIAVAGTYYCIVKWGAAGLGNDILMLTQIYGSGLTYVSLLYAIAKLKEKFIESEIQSGLLSSLANTDMLTGAFSRHKVEKILDYYIANINIHKKPLSVMLLDLDKLKRINDIHGHHAGDYALRRTVEILKSNLRDNDCLGRIGGDEFLLICPNTDLDNAVLLAQRLENAVSITEFDNIGKITISIGVATYQQGDTSPLLINRADVKMYDIKKKFKGIC